MVPRSAKPPLAWPVRVLAGIYGVLTLAFGLGLAVAQLRFALRGCHACWVAVPIMLFVAAVGSVCVWAAITRGGPRSS